MDTSVFKYMFAQQALIERDLALYTLLLAFALKIVVFILGFLTVKMGNALLRDGIKGGFRFSTDVKGIQGALESGSPGLLFVLLGVILIGYAMFVSKGVETIPYHPEQTAQPPAPTVDAEKEDTLSIGPIDTNRQQNH